MTAIECGYCYDRTEQLKCDRTDSDWVIGYDGNTSDWFLCRADDSELSTHDTHNDALREAIATDPHVRLFHEATGGGCLGEWELSVSGSPYNDADESY